MNSMNCPYCNVKIKFTNKPLFGKGRFQSGEVICYPCLKLISRMNPEITNTLKRLTKDEFEEKYSDVINKLNRGRENSKDAISSSASKLKEVKYIPEVLMEGEKVIKIIQGMKDGLGILFLTNKRVCFMDKKTIGGIEVEDISLSRISSIKYSSGVIAGEIVIYTSSNEIKIKMVKRDEGRAFVSEVNQCIHKEEITPSSQSEESITDKIIKLGQLKEQGLISEEEFNSKKSELLDRM